MIDPSVRDRIAGWHPETRRAVALSATFFVVTLAFGLAYVQRDDAPMHILRSRWILKHGWVPFDEYAFEQSYAYVYPPAFHVLGALSKLLVGTYLAAPAAAGALSVFLTYRLVSLLSDRSLGLSTAVVLAVNPMFVLWSGRMYAGTLVVAGFLLTAVLYFTYRERGDRRYLYATFVVGGGLAAVKTYGPAAAGIVLFHLLWIRREDLAETGRTVAAPLAAGVLASLPWPIRNFLRTGSPIPKVTGYRATESTTASGPSGLATFLPTVTETRLFLARGLGVVPPDLTTEHLGAVHPLLPILWLAVPLSLLAVIVYGARSERVDPIVPIWIGTFCVLYVVQRVASGGRTGFKYRHFVTVTPLLCLLFVQGYRAIDVDARAKRVVGVLLAGALLTQMLGAAAVQTTHTRTAWGPPTDWVEQNVDHDEVIYYQTDPRNFAYRVDPDYKFITTSGKEGYIHPAENFTAVVGDRADWVIVNDNADAAERAKVRHAVRAGVLERVTTLNATGDIAVGGRTLASVGRTWYVYRVVDGAGEPAGTEETTASVRLSSRWLSRGTPGL